MKVVMALLVPLLMLTMSVDAADGEIRPGVQMRTSTGQCTSNFLFTDGDDYYLGFAAHCTGGGGDATDTNGCRVPLSQHMDIGDPVTIRLDDYSTTTGTLHYSSWRSMIEADEPKGGLACNYNDFALVKIAEADEHRVNGEMIVFGGPTGMVDTTYPVRVGTQVVTFGNTGLREPVFTVNGAPWPDWAGVGRTLDAREGVVFLGGNDWTTSIYTNTPGLPGDSGSGVMTSDGEAVGILVTLRVTPYAGSNGVTNLDKALAYANDATGAGYTLVTGTFHGGTL